MRSSKKSRNSGFALVIALGLMAFIVLLLLGVSTFVRVESQAAAQSLRMLEARQNALLALQVAFGELQAAAGPDQRVTSTADLLSESHADRKHWVGVWSSDPASGASYGRLLTWLASDAVDTNAHGVAVSSPAVRLLGEGTVGSDTAQQVSVGLSDAALRDRNGNLRGRYGWWVGDSGVRARFNLPESTPATAIQGRLRDRLHRSSFARSSLAGFDAPFSEISAGTVGLDRVFSWGEAEVLNGGGFDPDTVGQMYHQLDFWSKGVLANVRDGGLKKDLSMAFEMNDGDFNNSVFAGNGADRINAPQVGWVQPLFVHEGSYGPAWHLLRDYATIYQRMESVLGQAEFSAQSHFPNVSDMGNTGVSAWNNAPANLYAGGIPANNPLVARETLNEGTSGDPLRAGAQMPISIRANYAPYLQRHISEMAVGFEPVEPTNPGDPEERWVRLLVRPQFVMHNPYNVRVRHPEMATIVDHLRFQVRIVSLDSPTEDEFMPFTEGNWSIVRIPSGVMEPGEVRLIEGLATNDFRWSATGPRLDYFPPSGGQGPYLHTETSGGNRVRIPAGNVQIFYRPFPHGVNPDRWAFRMSNHMLAPSDGNLSVVNTTSTLLLRWMSITSTMMRADVYSRVSEWYGGEDTAGIVINTEDHRDLDGDAPKPFFVFDAFLKPAGYNSPYVGSALRYPTFTHSNPAAPVLIGRNLLPLFRTHDSVGFPVMTPDWQVEIAGGVTGALPIQYNTFNNRGYWGRSHDFGTTAVSTIELPTTPLQSLGQLQNANVSLLGYMPALAIGNSFASPYINRNALIQSFNNEQGNSRVLHDISYLANEALWDDFYFSSFSRPYQAIDDRFSGTVGNQFDAIYVNGSVDSLPNARMQLELSSRERIDQVRDKWIAGNGGPLPSAYRRTAENLMVAGAFNLHSTSVAAWRAVLSGARDLAVDVLASGGVNSHNVDEETPFGRLNPANAGPFYSGSIDSPEAWQGFRALSDAQITALAQAIVDELRDRVQTQGNRPFLSMAEYVNRRLGNDRFGLSGLLQSAIERSGINDVGFENSAYRITAASLSTGMGAGVGSFPAPNNILEYNGDARSSAIGAPTNINQADLLQVIGSFISPRSDTFVIRAYGDSLSSLNGEVVSKAWCEAVVQRIPEPLIPANSNPAVENFWIPESMANNVSNSVDDPFGYARKFRVVSFRWLSEEEI